MPTADPVILTKAGHALLPRIVEGVRYARAGIMVTDELKVNSYHHQAIKDLASGLLAVACSPDGVIEAVESSDLSKGWMIGVQWHAEAMRDAGPEHRNLFEAHVSAAKRHALRHAAA
jgi:putative glutamine amidotransferase